ncbi:site-specific DNA-methyltransferase [uncultured Bacteroides sp.]|uniref:site-specific DNA-methyltransferase n=1 Tax=uncultured Bacteroides sp. TaxID=162156 RepID=UPI00259738F5|nr:site-specific DNA-methyltransferase [uncultured Bacteroides sp.]
MAIKYVPYFPNTLEGQALLDNFVRTKRILRYRDNNKVIEHIERGMPFYETELQEKIGKNPDGNLIIRGECVSACAYLKDKGISVDLVYIDPPFASGADYAKKVYIRRNPKVAEAMRQAEIELDVEELKAFEEKMYGDIWDKERYLNWMYENLMAIKSVMSDTASIYVHLDWHIGHYVKVLMDEVFGEDNFRNEIVWKRSTAHNDSTGFANLHDSIFYYSKSLDLFFDIPLVPYTQEYIDRYYNKEDENGRKYLDRDLSAKGLKGSGYSYAWKGKSGYWRCPITTMERFEKEGRLYYTNNDTPRYKQYLDEMEGVPAQDLWTDIFAVNSQADERVDYPTQKPESLLERIIRASSDKGMVVADFFGGSGVTASVSHKLNRRFIHCDIGINSIQTVRDRLMAAKAEFDILEIKDGVSLYRNPVQTMEKLKSLIIGLRNEDALDKFWEGSIMDTKCGMMPVYLPNLMDSSTRLLDKPLMNRIIREAMPDLPDDVKRVIVYYIDIIDRKEIEQFIKEQGNPLIEIELRDLKQVLDNVVVEDYAEWQLAETQDNLFKGWQVEIIQFHSDRVLKKIEAINLKGEQQVAQFNLKNSGKGKEKRHSPITISDEGLETIEWISLDCSTADKEAIWHSNSEVKIDKLGYTIRNGIKTNEFWDARIRCDHKPLRMKIRNICGDETVYTL